MAGGAPPKRKFRMMFLGAGASKAAGLPLTEELLQRIWPRDHENVDAWESRRTRLTWKRDLQKAVTVLYPDGGVDGFRPPVSEFFTLLEVIDRVHAGRERIALSTEDLLRDLRGEIATGLAVQCVAVGKHIATSPHYSWFKKPGRPNVVITSNWDTLVEQAAIKAGLTVFLGWPLNARGQRRELASHEMVLLKLHGSIDWGSADDERVLACLHTWKYEHLSVGITPAPHARRSLPAGGEEVLRYRAVDAPIAL